MLQPELSGDFGKIMQWADASRRMTVRTNAETPADARAARSFGAEGIGTSAVRSTCSSRTTASM